jgi:hypothetical protein
MGMKMSKRPVGVFCFWTFGQCWTEVLPFQCRLSLDPYVSLCFVCLN